MHYQGSLTVSTNEGFCASSSVVYIHNLRVPSARMTEEHVSVSGVRFKILASDVAADGLPGRYWGRKSVLVVNLHNPPSWDVKLEELGRMSPLE